MSVLDVLRPYKQFDFTGFVPVIAVSNGQLTRIGWTKPELAKALAGFGYVFRLADNQLMLNPELLTYQARTEAVDAILLQASAEGFLPASPDYAALGMGDVDWFAVGSQHAPLFELRRFYSTYMGIKRYGSRINAYHDGQMWVTKRGPQVHDFPGYWDALVGGGQVVGRTIAEHTMIEAHEEAGLSAADCQTMRSTGQYYIIRPTADGYLYDETIYTYDLDTGGVIVPKIMAEWETAAIELWPYDKVLQTLYHTTAFRPEGMMCLLDFFIRHGIITPDNEPNFDHLFFNLHSLLPIPELR